MVETTTFAMVIGMIHNLDWLIFQKFTWSIACLLEIEFALTKLADLVVTQRKHLFTHFVHLVLQNCRIKWPESFCRKKADNIFGKWMGKWGLVWFSSLRVHNTLDTHMESKWDRRNSFCPLLFFALKLDSVSYPATIQMLQYPYSRNAASAAADQSRHSPIELGLPNNEHSTPKSIEISFLILE